MNNFTDILKEYNANKELANEEIIHNVTNSVKQGKIKSAKNRLELLTLDYRGLVQKNAIYILCANENNKKFVEISTNEFGCYSSFAEDIYNKMIFKVSPVLYTNSPGMPTLLNFIMGHFEDIAAEIGLASYKYPTFRSEYATLLSNKQDLLNWTVRVTNDQIGSDIVLYNAAHEVSKKAITEGYSGKYVPIVLEVENKKLLEELAKNQNKQLFVINPTEKLTSKKVEAILTEIRNKVNN